MSANQNERLLVVPITDQNKSLVPPIYKAVFSGHPWHEDKICQNSLNETNKCMIQYTEKICNKYDVNRETGEISNDCRSNYSSRYNKKAKEGIFLLPKGGLEKCVGCGEPLKLIEFYPDFCDHVGLVEEALNQPGFIGYLLQAGGRLIGFSWGYKTPKERTKSVNFPEVRRLLKEKGIDPDIAFYSAETGIVEDFQGKGLVWILGAQNILDAKKQGSSMLIVRTINPSIHGYLKTSFSGKEGEFLFKDPERSSLWFAWDFKDFDEKKVKQKIEEVLGKFSKYC